MIEIKDLTKIFSKTVLNQLNLTINKGERIALIGQNGSGKTTLIRCLMGLYRFQGEISIFGNNISKNRIEALRKISFVPQISPQLKSTLKDLITLNSNLYGADFDEVLRIGNLLGLDIKENLKKPFIKLSGGMKQKFLISLTLTRKSAFLILDEPTANLDPEARNVFMNLLHDLPIETSVLITSHRIKELEGFINRTIELDQGNIILDTKEHLT